MMLLGVAAVCGMIIGLIQPPLAEIAGFEPLSQFAQLGVVGGSFTLLAIVLLRTLPKIASEYREGMNELGDKIGGEISGMRTDLRTGQDSTIQLLREAIYKNNKE